ncbi:MAG: SecDF P1 head subdomain-containing protein, partial [Gammaproteobacteria bacterium]
MKRTLRWKVIFIVVVVLGCLLGITGIPSGLSGRAILASTVGRIHLGLDLQGGTHLILQVHVDDAVNGATDAAMGRLQEDLTKRGIPATVSKPDPKNHPERLVVQGLPPQRSADFRTLVDNDLGPSYDVRPLPGNSTSYELVMKPTEVEARKQRALQQSIETIGNRINQLGVTEPTVQQHGLGEYQILVQLPGISDAAHVQQVMQESGQLSIHLVRGGPFPDQATALAQYGGVLPADSILLPGGNMGGAEGDQSGQQWYVLSRTAAVTGDELRDAEPQTGENGGMQVGFTLTRAAGNRFGNFTGQNIGKQLAVVLDNSVKEAAVI